MIEAYAATALRRIRPTFLGYGDHGFRLRNGACVMGSRLRSRC
jgi:hypothetical protein